jgi:hypothetical protein
MLARTVLIWLAIAGAMVSPAMADDGYSTAPVEVPDPFSFPEIFAVEAEHHDTFDRFVLRFSGPVPGYNIRYVPEVTVDASDQPVALQGSAFMIVTVHSIASAQVDAPPAPQDRQQPGFPQLRELVGAGDFEGYVSYGLGLTSASGFRVSTLTDPDRLVVDLRIPDLAETGSGVSRALSVGVAALLAGVISLGVTRRRGLSMRQ